MREGGIKLQCFAIYLSEKLGQPGIGHILDQIDLFQEKVRSAGLISVRSSEELEALLQSSNLGGFLSIEGADGLEGKLSYLRCCYELGVRFLGLTWNHANWAADGVMEPRNGGFTQKGRQLVEACHSLGITLDVSHLSPAAFWELIELSAAVQRPFIASHSNAYRICPHPRNLQDEQIRAIVSIDGMIGLTFVPQFVKQEGRVTAEDLFPHIEHLCLLGAENHLMFGSDFDGIDQHIEGLEHAGCYEQWAEKLLRRYPEDLVNRWLSGNALRFLRSHLPSGKKAL